jgi:hypothetical protein
MLGVAGERAGCRMIAGAARRELERAAAGDRGGTRVEADVRLAPGTRQAADTR